MIGDLILQALCSRAVFTTDSLDNVWQHISHAHPTRTPLQRKGVISLGEGITKSYMSSRARPRYRYLAENSGALAEAAMGVRPDRPFRTSLVCGKEDIAWITT